MTIGRRRWLRKNPAPPPTPEGMVYASWVDRFGNKSLKLVPAEQFQNYCQSQIGILDELTPEQRKRVHETGEVPTREVVQVNTGIAHLGISLIRSK